MSAVLILVFATVMTLLHFSNPYILLTANMDDVQILAQQLAKSPVMDELNRMWRRASNQVKQKIREPQHEKYSGRRTNSEEDELIELGKNASVYIKMFKRMLNNL